MDNDKAVADRLKSVPLFSQTSPRQRKSLAKLGRTLTWKAGSTPIVQGSKGAAFFLILEGSIEIVKDGTAVARMGNGDFVGEIALLKNQPRNADVNALSETTVFAFGRPALSAALKAEPAMALPLLYAMADRSSAL
jgi:CRP-like cAMP-binding protein